MASIYDTIAQGQLYFFLLFLFSLFLFGLKKEWKWQPSLALSLMMMLKGYGLIPLLWLAVKKKWNIVLLTVGMCFTIFFVSLPIFSPDVWKLYFRDVVSQFGNHPMNGHTAYQTMSSFVLHLFSYDEKWLPYPLAVLPGSIIKLVTLALIVFLLFIVFRMKSSKKSTQDMMLLASATIAANVLTIPFAEEHHFVLFLPLVIGMFVLIVRGKTSPMKLGTAEIFFFISVLIVALPLRYETMNEAEGLMVLLAYPKLFAGIMIIVSSSIIINQKK